MPQDNDGQEQALELTPELEQPSATLLAFYEGLPGEVVTVCEEARTGIIRDTITHLRTARDALAPYGRFKEWCEAAGFNYRSVTNRLDYLDNSKQRVLKISTAPLVNPSGVQRITVHLTHIPPASPPPATEVVDTSIAASDAVAESYGDDDGDYDWDNPDDASPAEISDFMAKSPAQMMAYAFTRFRDICEGKDSNSGHTSYLPVTPEALQAWWRGVDNREWIQALKTLDWFLDATKPYQEFLESHRHRTPPMAKVLKGQPMQSWFSAEFVDYCEKHPAVYPAFLAEAQKQWEAQPSEHLSAQNIFQSIRAAGVSHNAEPLRVDFIRKARDDDSRLVFTGVYGIWR